MFIILYVILYFFNCLLQVPGKLSERSSKTSLIKVATSTSARKCSARLQSQGLRQHTASAGQNTDITALLWHCRSYHQQTFHQLLTSQHQEHHQQNSKQLVRYIDTTWISNPIWTPRNWSIYKTSIRTNNDVEGILIFCFIHPFSHPKKRNNKKFM